MVSPQKIRLTQIIKDLRIRDPLSFKHSQQIVEGVDGWPAALKSPQRHLVRKSRPDCSIKLANNRGCILVSRSGNPMYSSTENSSGSVGSLKHTISTTGEVSRCASVISLEKIALPFAVLRVISTNCFCFESLIYTIR